MVVAVCQQQNNARCCCYTVLLIIGLPNIVAPIGPQTKTATVTIGVTELKLYKSVNYNSNRN